MLLYYQLEGGPDGPDEIQALLSLGVSLPHSSNDYNIIDKVYLRCKTDVVSNKSLLLMLLLISLVFEISKGKSQLPSHTRGP